MTPIFAVLVSGLLTVTFGLLVRGLFRKRGDEGLAEWFESFSLDSYRPMLRLLNDWDCEFLSGQPGYTPLIGAKLRKERRDIFRGYMWQMFGDFNRLLRIGQIIAVQSEKDRSELPRMLMQLRLRFYWSWLFTQVYVCAHPFPQGAVSVRRLLASLETLQDSLQPPAALR